MSELSEAIRNLMTWVPKSDPNALVVSPVASAALQAAALFSGRDRRRIKREIRKAMDKARLEQRRRPQTPAKPSGLAAWRTLYNSENTSDFKA